MLNILPLSLYIHFPWCIKKYPYCDLNSYKNTNGKYIYEKYLKHLLNDLKQSLSLTKNRNISTIFIGGGNPSLLNIHLIKYLIKKIKKKIDFSYVEEISIEVDPNTINIKKIKEYINIGINRLSIGIQSFNKYHLKKLKRLYKYKNIIILFNQINKLNFKNINIDLIYGLPNQTINQAIEDLYKAIDLKIKHISWYQLTIESNKKFDTIKKKLPNEDIIFDMYQKGNKILQSYGYKKYEISSYAKSDIYFCKHNLNYWLFGDYLGIGCGAHSKLTKKNKIIRLIKIKNPYIFMQGKYIKKKYEIKNIDKTFEFFMNRFRLSQNILKKDFFYYTGIKNFYIKHLIKKAIKKKFLLEDKNFWILTKKGRYFLNDLLILFL